MIDGVIITPLRKIVDERGAVMHMLRRDWPVFEEFGEIYFSTIHADIVKAWHYHEIMTLNYAVPLGKIKMVLHDDREDSLTRGETQEIYLGDDNYSLVTVPPKIWNGFKGVGDQTSIVANCATIPHDPSEISYRDPFDPDIGYDWNVRHG